jgi:glycosyltransferase involved in cell wall biosynthesis
MNIGINARLFIKGKMEGVATYIHENVRRMIDNHPEDNFILFFDRNIDFEHLCSKPNVKAVKVFPPTRHPILWEIWWQWQIPRYLKKYSVDVFYTGEIFMPRKTKVPRVIVSHDLAYLHYPKQIPKSVLNYYKRTYSVNHKLADAIIAVSEATKHDIFKQYGKLDKDIHVIYNATTSGFKPITSKSKKEIQRKHSNGAPFFAYLGSFHPRKNIVNLVKGFESFKKNSTLPHKLVLMGRWSWKTEEIKQTITNSQFRDDIVILEDVGDSRHDIVAASEALCYVSVFEGFGIPVLEGFSAGVPVITSNVSSMPEVAGDAALLIDPHDPNAIGNAMSSVVKDQALKEQLIQKGFSRVKEFDWNISAKQTYEVLKSVVK